MSGFIDEDWIPSISNIFICTFLQFFSFATMKWTQNSKNRPQPGSFIHVIAHAHAVKKLHSHQTDAHKKKIIEKYMWRTSNSDAIMTESLHVHTLWEEPSSPWIRQAQKFYLYPSLILCKMAVAECGNLWWATYSIQIWQGCHRREEEFGKSGPEVAE